MAKVPDRNNPEKEAKKDVPSRQSRGMDPNEREFWDLDENLDPGERPPKEVEPAVAPIPAPSGEVPPPGQAGEAASPGARSEPEPGVSADPESGGVERHEDGPVEAEPDSSPEDPHAPKRSEKISLIVLGVLLLAIAVAGIALFFKDIPTEPTDSEIEFPVTGERITIEEVETIWRRPDRERDRGVQQKVRLIPTARVTLGNPSSTGALRFFFEDDSGRLIGDATTLAVADGAFVEGGAAETEIYCTGGFEDTGDHAAYVTGQIDTWHLIITEGPDPDATGKAFQTLLRVPISKKRK